MKINEKHEVKRMRQNNLPDEMRDMLNSLDELLHQQENLLNNMKASFGFDSENTAHTVAADTVTTIHSEADESIVEIDAIIKNNKQTLDDCRSKAQPAESKITELQLKALSRKHLLMMILDLQEELDRLKEENEKMFTAYQAGAAQRPRTD